MGFNKSETVKYVSEKHGVTTRDIYHHLEIKDKWISDFIELNNSQEAYYENILKLDHIYRETMFLYLHAHEDSIKLGCLNSLRNTCMVKAEMQGLQNVERGYPNVKHLIEVVDPVKEETYINWSKASEEEKVVLTQASRIIQKYQSQNHQRESLH